MAEPAGKKKSGAANKKSNVYKISGEAVARLNKMCPRCGAGNFLAEHADRFHCGRCKYTLFKTREPAVAAAAAPAAAKVAVATPAAVEAPKKP